MRYSGPQRIGTEKLNFLSENRGDGVVVQLLPGIAYCFRKFHALIIDLVQGAWVRYVRQQNLTLIGETADLHEFLFGSERNSLATVRPGAWASSPDASGLRSATLVLDRRYHKRG
jgi:hypothetical protein